jgi:hypothetical protein
MFKKLTFIVAFLAYVGAVNIFAQDAPRQVISVTAVYNRENVNIKNLQGESVSVDYARDSLGGQVSWDFHPARNAFFIGMDGGVTFHNKALDPVTIPIPGGSVTSPGRISRVAKGYFDYRMGIAKRTGTFQPWIAGTVGIKNGNFGSRNGFLVRQGSSFTYGGTGGIDLCFGQSKRKCFRAGVSATKAFGRETQQWDISPQVGFAIKFGK